MADAAARREARRKRILENSENRLQRITGTNNSVREDKPIKSFALLHPEAKAPEDEIVPDTNAQPAEAEGHLFSESYLEGEEYVTENASASNELRERNADGHKVRNHSVINERFSLNENKPNTVNKATNESDQDVNTHDSVRRVSTQQSLAYSVFTSKWILVLLAAFVNLLYILQLQHLCGKAILVPFLTLMLVRLHLADSKSESQGGSMLSAALILCNIKPELVYSLRWVTRTVKKIMEEFAIYIFSFVVFYNAACSYWKDIDVTILTIESGNNGELQ